MRKEQQQPGREKGTSPPSLRDYWSHPTGRLPALSPAPSRSSVTTPSLWEQTTTLEVRSGSALIPGDERTQRGSASLAPTEQSANETLVPLSVTTDAPYRRRQLSTRLEQRGVSSLSNAELLSLVLYTHPGNESLVQRVSSLLSTYSVQQLLQADFGEVSKQYGFGKTKAAQLQAVLEVARRLTLPTLEETYRIGSPADAAQLLMPEMAFLDHEELRVLLLDTKNGVVANLLLYQGTINSSVLRAAEIFRPAVTRKCPGVLIAHNHPSGDPTPSPEDIAVTEQLVHAGNLLEVELVDHLVIGQHRFTSLKERLRW